MIGFRRRSGNGRRVFIAAATPLVVGSSYCFAAPPAFSSGITTGTIQNATITEASGIAASRMNLNVLWTHDDSGSGAQVVPMTPAGVSLGTYTISGAGATDWEDIAVGPGPTAGAQYLYVGDIGDNLAFRSSVAVYRVPEPVVSDTQAAASVSVSGAVRFNLAYPNGPHDAESLFVDPLTKDIYIISKRETTKYVYRAAYPQSSSGTTTMQLVTTLNNADWITAADISPDGDEIIMRSTSTDSGLLYTRPAGGSIADALATTPVSIPLLSEGQGEAIGFDPQGWGYYTTTEGAAAPIHYFDRLPPPAGTMYWDNDGVAAASRSATGAGLGGGGTWNASALKWYNGSADVPWQSGNDAVFWGTAGTVTLSAAQTVNSLSFKTSGYVIAGSTLTLGGSSVTVDPGVTATVNSVVAGTAGLVKNGGGTLQLATANTYSGGTTVNAGVLGIVSSSLGASLASPAINLTINNGATLRFDVNGLTLATNRQVLLGPGGGVIDVQGFSDSVAGVISGSSLTKAGAGTLTLRNANTYTAGTTVNAGVLVLAHADALGTGGLTVNNATVLAELGLPNAVSVASVTTTGTGKLDLTDNDLVIRSSTLAAVQARVTAGFHGGDWLGAGVTSSAAATDSNNDTALGYADNAELGYTSFSGVPLTGPEILVKYTYFGDADLTGVVDLDDFGLFLTGYQTGSLPRTWLYGDFDYTGVIDLDDFGLFLYGYQHQGGSLSVLADAVADTPGVGPSDRAFMQAAIAAVPEPASLGALAAAAVGLLRRRRRRIIPRHSISLTPARAPGHDGGEAR